MLMCLSPLSQVNQFRQLYAKVINDKHDDVMAKFGAILAQGVLDAGRPLQITPTPPNNPNTPPQGALSPSGSDSSLIQSENVSICW